MVYSCTNDSAYFCNTLIPKKKTSCMEVRLNSPRSKIWNNLHSWQSSWSYSRELSWCYNQLQKCWDTPTEKRPFLPQITHGHRSVNYNTDLLPPSKFKVVPPSFEYGLVLLATLIRGGGGSQAQDHGQAIYASVSSTFATGCSFSEEEIGKLTIAQLKYWLKCHCMEW